MEEGEGRERSATVDGMCMAWSARTRRRRGNRKDAADTMIHGEGDGGRGDEKGLLHHSNWFIFGTWFIGGWVTHKDVRRQAWPWDVWNARHGRAIWGKERRKRDGGEGDLIVAKGRSTHICTHKYTEKERMRMRKRELMGSEAIMWTSIVAVM